MGTPSDKKEMYEKIYEERLEKEMHTHEILWKAESYFTALISGLIAVGFSIAHFSLYATYGIMPVAIVFTFLGRYVLIRESEYFHGYRYERLKVLEKLGYNKLEVVEDFPEFKNLSEPREKYV